MTTTRRGFLGAMLLAAAAPAIVRAGSLMPIYVPKAPGIIRLWGDGVHDDTAALQLFIDGQPVLGTDGKSVLLQPAGGVIRIPAGRFLISERPLVMDGKRHAGITGGHFISSREKPAPSAFLIKF